MYFQQQANTPRTARSPSVSSTHSNSSASNNNQAPTTKPPTPPVYRASTIGRAAGAQQTRPVAPPMAPPQPIPPQGNFPRYPQSGRSSVSAGSSYSPSNTMVMGQLHSPSMGQSMLPGIAYNPSPNTLHNMTRSANPSLMHPEAKGKFAYYLLKL